MALTIPGQHYSTAANQHSVSATAVNSIQLALNPKPKPTPNFDKDVLDPLRQAQAAKAAADVLAAQQAAQAAADALAAQQAAQAAQSFVAAPVASYGGDIQALAQSILASRGLSGDWGSMNYIITRESGWNLYARNPEGACGLVQALPCSKIVWGDASMQINWFIDYCAGRYGSIGGAYQHWLAYSWY